MAVAVEAPFHLQRVLLPREVHQVDAPVAGDASDAFVHVDAVVEVDEVRQIVHLDPLDRRLVRKLARTGSSIGLSIQICEWQFMHVLVGGTPAYEERSTDVWQ